MPDVKFPTIDLDQAAADLNKAVREAAYVAVGLGVLGFQKAQVQRVELSRQLEAQMAGLATFGEQLNGQAEPYIEAAQKQVADLRDQLAKLASDLMGSQTPVDAATVRIRLTELAKSADEALAPVRQQLEEQLDRLEEVLPATARELVQTVRGAAAAQEQAVRSAVGL